jgi:hypothetical protein
LDALFQHTAAYKPPAPGAGVERNVSHLPGRQQWLASFWGSSAGASEFAYFLRLYDRHGLPDELAAPILADALYRLRDCYQLPPAVEADAARAFHAEVRAPDVVASATPTPDGEFTMHPSLTLYEGFAVYEVTFWRIRRPGDLSGSGYGYSVVYARRGKRWHRLGKVHEWVT